MLLLLRLDNRHQSLADPERLRLLQGLLVLLAVVMILLVLVLVLVLLAGLDGGGGFTVALIDGLGGAQHRTTHQT
jgi:hypothetical protein